MSDPTTTTQQALNSLATRQPLPAGELIPGQAGQSPLGGEPYVEVAEEEFTPEQVAHFAAEGAVVKQPAPEETTPEEPTPEPTPETTQAAQPVQQRAWPPSPLRSFATAGAPAAVPASPPPAAPQAPQPQQAAAPQSPVQFPAAPPAAPEPVSPAPPAFTPEQAPAPSGFGLEELTRAGQEATREAAMHDIAQAAQRHQAAQQKPAAPQPLQQVPQPQAPGWQSAPVQPQAPTALQQPPQQPQPTAQPVGSPALGSSFSVKIGNVSVTLDGPHAEVLALIQKVMS